MRSALAGFTGVVLFAMALVAPAQDDQALIARAAAERGTVSTSAAGSGLLADDLGSEERQARIEVSLAQTRLELVLAKKSSRLGQHRDAAVHALRVQDLLRQLPESVDTESQALQAEGILARAEKAGVNVAALRNLGASEAPATHSNDYLEVRARAAAAVARGYSGADRDTINTRADADTLRRDALRRQTPGRQGYQPGKEIFDRRTIRARDNQRLYYQAGLRDAYRADEARMLTAAHEARVVPDGDVAYPDDWPRKVARRAKFAGGQIARSNSWIDEDGREWYVAVYDIHDLIYVPPDFQIPYTLDVYENYRIGMDREALRWRSGIFNSWNVSDIAAGIPLLRYFGGIDDYAYRGPAYSIERQDQIVEMIKAFSMQPTESKIIPLAP